MDKILFDLDDLWEGPHPEIWHGEPRFDLLLKLKEVIPQLKVTLFASPGLCSPEYLKYVAKHDWIELGMHGWYHTSLECSNWTQSQTSYCLSWWEDQGYPHIFRPPQWAHNVHLLTALKKRNWIYAGHPDHVETKEFPGMKYVPIGQNMVHGHLTSGIANSIDVLFAEWAREFKDKEFEFITKATYEAYQNLPSGQQPV